MDTVHIKPIPNSPQERFCKSPVRELGFGGAAGGAKTMGLILDVLYQLPKPGYNAVLFRLTYPQLEEADGLIELSKSIYPALGGIYNESKHIWRFPEFHNNTIRFSHMELEKRIERRGGPQYAYVGFDELGDFAERQYLFLFSRNRTASPDMQLYVRSTFNPGGIGHSWIKKRFIEPFLNGEGFIKSPKYFKRVNGRDTETDEDDKIAISRLFIPSRLEDNPFLWNSGDSDYDRNLHQLDSVDFRRLRHGDWDVRRTGRVYHAFTDKNIGPDSRDLDYDKVAGYYHSHDFGAVNHVWGLWAKIDKRYYLIYVTKLPEGTTAARAKLIKAVFAKATRHFVDEIMSLDPNMKIEDAVKMALSKVVGGYGGAKSEKQYRLDFGREGVIIREPSMSNLAEASSVKAQVNQTNTMLDSSEMMICSNCVHAIDQLENCVHDEQEGIADKATWHYVDMIRYFAAGIKRGVLIG